ncbi:phage minor tail protein L [Pokkaliibacter sp. MBI-7]|uniref:phage minor tail protein L n=1 Tax=Pokkaliibacter sp. MBI-7 TaxID=3040600 RepID=UPI002446F08A|nr:phage minor tail protein L [Pokkaliibacter sp. MBI-7]MDH2435585.1 phage minor tail protein L [Pokkaliibacter sp. MBI-7]
MSDIIARESQQLEQEAIVELFEMDATAWQLGVLRWITAPVDGGPARFNGYEYTPMPIQAEGFQWNGTGTLPQPSLTISCINPDVVGLVIGTHDILGCEIRRLRTYRHHLDDGSDPDPEALFPIDYFVIDQKAEHTSEYIRFTLKTQLDQQGVKLPRRLVLRDTCTHAYRYYRNGQFVYSNATCPYAGDACYNPQGEAVSPAEDRCGKRLRDCKLRFGENATLPTRAFPGVKRY